MDNGPISDAVESGLIDRTCRLSLILGAILFTFLAPYSSIPFIWGLSSGLLLSALNLVALQHAVRRLLSPTGSRLTRGLILVKFPLLIGAAFLLLRHVSPAAFAVGYGLPLGVIVLKSVGRSLTTRSPQNSAVCSASRSLNADAEGGAGAAFHSRDEMHGGFPS